MYPKSPTLWPIGKANVAREGDDITMVGIGYTTGLCLQAADILERQGVKAEVIDLLSPFADGRRDGTGVGEEDSTDTDR